MNDPPWLDWAKRIQAIGQTGLYYSKDPYDKERYEQIREIAVEMMAYQTGEDPLRVKELLCGEVGYATPKVDVRGVVFQDDSVLLVQEAMDGKWTLPGGWADVKLSPGENAAKEVREESGYEVRPERLLAIYDRDKHPHPPCPFHIYKLFIECRIIGGEARASLETLDVGFFPVAKLPQLSVSRVTEDEIARLYLLAASPGQPAEFD